MDKAKEMPEAKKVFSAFKDKKVFIIFTFDSKEDAEKFYRDFSQLLVNLFKYISG